MHANNATCHDTTNKDKISTEINMYPLMTISTIFMAKFSRNVKSVVTIVVNSFEWCVLKYPKGTFLIYYQYLNVHSHSFHKQYFPDFYFSNML